MASSANPNPNMRVRQTHVCRKYYDLELHEKQQAAKAAKKGKSAADDEVGIFGWRWLAVCWHAGRGVLCWPTWQA